MNPLEGLLASLLNPNPGVQRAGLLGPNAMAQTGLGPEQLARYHQMSGFGGGQAMPAPQAAPSGAMQAPAAPQAPDQMQTASTAAPAPSGGGIGGMLQGLFAPKAAQKNRTVQLLMQDGLDEGTATLVAQDKPSLNMYLRQRAFGEGPKADEYQQRSQVAQQYGLQGDEAKAFILTGQMPKAETGPTPTDDMREFDYARQQGYKGTFFDWQKENKGGVTVNTGDYKIPTGFRYKDTANPDLGVEPIPGGPEDKIGSQKAAEEASKSGMQISTDVITGAAAKAREAYTGGSFYNPTGGTAGNLAAKLPESNAAEVRRQVSVLKSQAQIETLKAMRLSSPTGASGLGALSDNEAKILADKAGALDPASPGFARDLDDYERTLLRTIHGTEAGDAIYAQTHGGGVPQAAPGAPNPERFGGKGDRTQKRLKFNPATGELE